MSKTVTALSEIKPMSDKNQPVGKMTDLTIIAGYQTKDGRQEVVYDIGPDFNIDSFVHSYKEKIAKTKDDEGNLVGFEPTGECVLNIKVEFHKE